MTDQLASIALLGTSADPPTCGHQALLEGLLKLFPKVATWASDNPMKHHGASLAKRHELLSTLVKSIANPNLQLVQELSSPWTIKTLHRAKKLWPNAQLTFVIGSDLTEQIPEWLQANELLRSARIGIAPREGWPITQAQLKRLESLGGQVDILPLKIPATASSEIRKRPESHLIPAAILPKLLEQNLYGLTA